MSGWLSAEDWKRAQETMPIPCVDIVPVRLKDDGKLEAIGLIFRGTPHQDRRWCVVGGRLWRNESVAEAIHRQLTETLGSAISFSLPHDPQPDYVMQYFTQPRDVGGLDPRQHALTLNFVVPIAGQPKAGGEAVDFRWFAPDRLPKPDEFGFGQHAVATAALRARRLI